MTDDEIVRRMAEELVTLPPADFTFEPHSLLMLVALVQLAKRHPHLTDTNRRFADRFLARARHYFATCAAVIDVIDRGDDPRQDVIIPTQPKGAM